MQLVSNIKLHNTGTFPFHFGCHRTFAKDKTTTHFFYIILGLYSFHLEFLRIKQHKFGQFKTDVVELICLGQVGSKP